MVLSWFGLIAISAAAPAPGPRFGQTPVSFERNQGQADPSVHWVARHGAMTMQITGAGSVISLGGSAVRMTLVGAQPPKDTQGFDRLPGVSHYYLGADPSRWRTNVPHFGQVALNGVYPGVDMLYHGGNDLEYDFLIAPGADPRAIGLQFEGGQVILDTSGDLRIATAAGDLIHRRPRVCQTIDGEAVPVAGAYSIDRNGVARFEIGDYRHDLPLVIDPVITYSTFLGGNSFDQANGVTMLGGDAVIAGTTASTDFPGLTVNRGFTDIFVTRLNAAGTGLVYSVFLGGSAVEEGLDIAYNAVSGELVVVGTTSSEDFPGVTGSFQSTLAGSFDAVITRLFANSGILIRSSYYGGSGQDDGMQVVIDSGGGIVIAGNTISPNLPLNGATDSTLDNSDGFVARFTQGLLVLEFGTYLGGSSLENVWALAAGAAGSVYVGGATFSTDFPVSNAFQATAKGTDGFITKFDVITRSIISSTYLGGSGGDAVKSLAVDGAGAVYAAGETVSLDFPTTAGAYDRTPNGFMDVFVAKFVGPSMQWSTLVGGSAADSAEALVVGPGGVVAVVGGTESLDFPTLTAPQPKMGGIADAFLFRLNAAGSVLLDSTFLGGAERDGATELAYSSATSVVVVGNTDSTNYPVSNGTFDSSFGGDTEGFVTQISDGPGPVTVTFQTNFPGATVLVDGATRTPPFTLQWAPGVTHSIGAEALQRPPGNQTLTWTSWSGTPGSGLSQNVVTPAAPATYTANFSALTCSYAVSPNPVTAPLSGGAVVVNVVTQSGCAWTASSNTSWITGSANRIGSGSVTFTVPLSPLARTGSVNVAFLTMPLQQDDLQPTVVRLSPASGTGFEQTFQFIFDDSRGANTLGIANVLINSAIDGRQACYPGDRAVGTGERIRHPGQRRR
ncbi:MAG: hypothetical protein R2762_04780 [Bryobacteraceae bacterium]